MSVLKHSPADCKVVVIDDCSPQGKLSEFLPEPLVRDERVSIVRNEDNLGFVKSCNRGMLELSGSSDVILLNSDTEVTRGWVEKLGRAARSRPEVATVTPLTNNGTICSVPQFAADNPVVPGFTADSFAALVEEVSANEYPELPTCVGFCTYIKRAAIEKLNGFDEIFGKGYGEENDFSCRARRLGWVDILDDATFIYHKGSMSFMETRTELQRRNSEILRQRHPLYFDNVGKFCRDMPLRNVHARIFNKLLKHWTRSKKLNVLHIVHNGPFAERHHPVGGTERHVQDIIGAVDDVAHWSLVPTPTAYYLTAHFGFAQREFILDRRVVTLHDLLKPVYFDLIHLQHIQGYQYGELDAALRRHGNYLISLHDYNLICPRVYLMTPYREHCTGAECTVRCSFGEHYISAYRQIAKDMLAQARSVICFSQSTREYFERIVGAKANWQVQPHGIVGLKSRPRLCGDAPEQPSITNPLKVAFVGFLPQHKGSLIIEKLLEHAHLPSGRPVEWHIVGELYGKAGSRAHQHGKYSREELPRIFASINPHLVCILSLCPETYSLTLDEAWNAGVPVLSTPLGAPGERVKQSGAGWVVHKLDADTVLQQLDEISSNWDDYLARRAKIEEITIIDTKTEGGAYAGVYSQYMPARRSDVEVLLTTFEALALSRPPQLGFLTRGLRRVVNLAIRVLERARLRMVFERFAYFIIPDKYLQALKSIR